MKAVLVLLSALFAVASAGIYGGYGHGHGHYVAPVAVKVPIATSYQHEYRTYHPVVPVVKYVAAPVVHHAPVVHAVPVHHGYGHGYGHGGGHGFGHGFAHFGGHGHY